MITATKTYSDVTRAVAALHAFVNGHTFEAVHSVRYDDGGYADEVMYAEIFYRTQEGDLEYFTVADTVTLGDLDPICECGNRFSLCHPDA